jgi:secondary thiamine-phosphate synthase enzyme
MDQLTIRTRKKLEVLDITSRVEEAVQAGKVRDGICLVFVPHSTAAIVINENADPNIGLDLLEVLDTVVPEGKWRHDRIDDNGAAHLKASILGPSETVVIREGKLALGTWQSIMLVELDGPRERSIWIKIR